MTVVRRIAARTEAKLEPIAAGTDVEMAGGADATKDIPGRPN